MPWLEVTSIASTRYQAFDPSSDSRAILLGASHRISAAGTVETRFFGQAGKVSMELRPSIRLAWTRAAIDQAGTSTSEPTQSSDFLPTYRIAGAIAPLEWLSLRGSASSGYKLPSLLQLFGNRSTVVSNTALIPERSMAYDGGVTARGRTGVLSGYASVGAFLTHLDNAIRPRPLPQGTIIFENIGSARIRGVEIELRGAITEHFVLQSETTWTQATDEERGRQLPGQPEWVVFAQPEAHSGALSSWVSDIVGFFQVAYVGESFSDPANLIVLPSRTVLAVGFGVDLFETRLGLSFRVDDLLDARGQDLLGFPLPGRRYAGRLSYRHAW
jgi:outer membrane receptor protein involved in Fe transport